MKKISAVIGYCLVSLFLFSPVLVNASKIEMQNINTSDATGDFQLGPTSFDIEGKPGDTFTRTLQVTNRSLEKKEYLLEFEDFEGYSDNPNGGINLLGENTSRYGAKDWVVSEINNFSLSFAERMYFDVTIKIPMNADTGDHYVAVLVSADDDKSTSSTTKKDQQGASVKLRSRSGSLFYVKVLGDVVENGELESFKTDKSRYEKTPVNFSVTYRNNGNVRLRPSGKIEIFNSRGKRIDIIEINEFNVLRGSVKLTNYQWNKKLIIGNYTAKLTLDRGYGDHQDTMETSFSVMPWQDIIIAVAILIALLGSVILIKKQGKKKRRK